MKTGLVLGKFYPPHNGHLYLIKYAEERVDELIVVVGSLPTETIPGSLRSCWLRDLVKDSTKIYHIPDDNPVGVTPKDESFWTIWRDNLINHLPYVPNRLFGGEKYLERIAKELGIDYTYVDRKRIKHPISGTMVRSDPKKYWDFIPKVVQEYYQEKGQGI